MSEVAQQDSSSFNNLAPRRRAVNSLAASSGP